MQMDREQAKCYQKPKLFLYQYQPFPGIEDGNVPLPICDNPEYKGSGKFNQKVAWVALTLELEEL